MATGKDIHLVLVPVSELYEAGDGPVSEEVFNPVETILDTNRESVCGKIYGSRENEFYLVVNSSNEVHLLPRIVLDPRWKFASQEDQENYSAPVTLLFY